MDELRRWQNILNRATHLDNDPFSDPVDFQDIEVAAKRLQTSPGRNWS